MKLKNKYQRMTKDQKHALLIEYKGTPKGKYLLAKLRNVFAIGIALYIYAIYALITASNIWEYIFGGILILFGCVFIIVSSRLKAQNLNRFAISKK